MDQRERIPDGEELLRTAWDAWRAGLWTSLPGIIQSVDFVANTCVVQPSIKGFQRVLNDDGSVVEKLVTMPLLLDVPLFFPSGGGFSMTFPVAAGDECLVVFADRCIDSWWQSGGVQPPASRRMHDLSDGFALVGFRSQPRRLGSVSQNTAQLRSDDGTVFVEVQGDKAKVFAPHVKVHAGVSYSWDVHGYGQVITWLGGADYKIDNYTQGANVTSETHNIQPPEAP